MDLALDHVNAKLKDDIRRPLRIGIGLHAGPLLLGRIGYGEAVDLTVIGNVVNAASRLEGLSKEKGAQIVMSATVAQYAGCHDVLVEAETVNVRGLSEPLQIITVPRGRDLPASILSSADDDERSAMQTA
jgi:adenylate cyclase